VSVWKDNVPVMPARVWHAWPTSKIGAASWDGAFDNGSHGEGQVFTYATGQGDIGQGGSHGFNPAPGSTDPGCYLVAGFGLPSECAYGFDLPANRHVAYVIAFRQAVYGETPPPPDPTPTPTGSGCLVGALEALVKALKGA
jgi:hypothetical protein